MKHWKLHAWVLINILMASYFLIEPSMLRAALILFSVVMIFSAFLLKHDVKISERFSRGFGFKEIVSIVAFVFITVRVKWHLNNPDEWIADRYIQYGLLGFMFFIMLCYLLTLRKRVNLESKSGGQATSELHHDID